MAELRDEDREYICRVKSEIERHKKMCATLEQACKIQCWRYGSRLRK